MRMACASVFPLLERARVRERIPRCSLAIHRRPMNSQRIFMLTENIHFWQCSRNRGPFVFLEGE